MSTISFFPAPEGVEEFLGGRIPSLFYITEWFKVFILETFLSYASINGRYCLNDERALRHPLVVFITSWLTDLQYYHELSLSEILNLERAVKAMDKGFFLVGEDREEMEHLQYMIRREEETCLERSYLKHILKVAITHETPVTWRDFTFHTRESYPSPEQIAMFASTLWESIFPLCPTQIYVEDELLDSVFEYNLWRVNTSLFEDIPDMPSLDPLPSGNYPPEGFPILDLPSYWLPAFTFVA